MKRTPVYKFILCVAAVLAIAGIGLLSTACSDGNVNKSDKIRVTLVSSEFYRAVNDVDSIETDRYSTVLFTVTPEKDYYITGTDYEGAKVETVGKQTVITIPSPKYSVRVRVNCKKIEEHPDCIVYDANGGSRDGEEEYKISYELNGHLRPNTDRGEGLARDGYTLIGWNTEPDGSGEECGLGSRCDLPSEGVTLYAQWVKWTAPNEFKVLKDGDHYIVTGCTSEAKEICVPEEIDGVPVTRISSDAFEGKNITRLVLPKTIVRVDDRAFRRSRISDFWFFDNMEYISDVAFEDGVLPRVHINAVLEPRYAKLDRHSNYADKADILRKYRDDKKIVLFGGSGTYFSINSKLIYNAFGGEYKVVNMGINGWFCATAQTDIILSYLKEGDIFIHIPEMESSVQLFYDTSFAVETEDESGKKVKDDRFMRTFEENYDLLSDVDLNKCAGFFDSFTRYNADRKKRDPVKYSDNPDFITEFGDYKPAKPPHCINESISGEAGIRYEFLNYESLDLMNRMYTAVKEKGASAFVAFAAVNKHGLIARDEKEKTDYLGSAELFEKILRSGIDAAAVLGDINSAIIDGENFFNSDWHLSDDAANINTSRLIDNLKKELEER